MDVFRSIGATISRSQHRAEERGFSKRPKKMPRGPHSTKQAPCHFDCSACSKQGSSVLVAATHSIFNFPPPHCVNSAFKQEEGRNSSTDALNALSPLSPQAIPSDFSQLPGVDSEPRSQQFPRGAVGATGWCIESPCLGTPPKSMRRVVSHNVSQINSCSRTSAAQWNKTQPSCQQLYHERATFPHETMAGLDAAFEQDHTWPSTSLAFTGVHEQAGEIGSVLRPAKRNRKHRTLGSPRRPLIHKKSKEMKTVEAREAPGKFVAVLGLQAAETVQRASAFHKSGYTAARVGPSNGQRAVAGRLYFHANKMAWRSELMVDGSKRQRSFSCKLYGYERARLLCEWSRNFVSQTARLPTDDETREAIRILMRLKIHTKHKAMDVSELMSKPQGLSLVGTGPHFQSRAENKHGPTSAQGKAADYRTRQCDSARNFTIEHLAGTCNNKESGTYWGLETLDQDNTSLPHFIHEYICADAKGKCGHCPEPGSKPLHQEVYMKSTSAQTAGGGAEAAVATHQSEGECPERQSVSIAANAFRELGSLTALKTTVKRTKRQKAGKKPQSGVRGLYIHQNAWKVNYIGRHGLATKLFAYPLGDIEEMKRQYLLARFFLRSIIEKKRQIYESDGEGLSEDEAVWTRRVERVGRFSQISSPRQVNTSMSCYKESLYGQKIPQISPNGAVSHQMHSELCSALDSVRKSGQKERSLALKQKSSQMTQKRTHYALGRGEQGHKFTLKLLPSFNEPGNIGLEDSFDTQELHKQNHWETLKLLLQRGDDPALSPLAWDDPDDGGLMMHSMIMSSEACPSSVEALDGMPTILNETKDSSGKGGGMVCKSK